MTTWVVNNRDERNDENDPLPTGLHGLSGNTLPHGAAGCGGKY